MPAKMYPRNPDFGPNAESSQEYKMYEILRQSLTEEYYVFYSLSVLRYKSESETLEERELDFLVFNAQKGLLYIEAKNGKPTCKNGNWFLANGQLMSHNGPYKQASTGIHSLVDKIRDQGRSDIIKACPYGFAVWFFGYNEEDFPIEDPDLKRITLYRDSNIKEKIDDIFALRKNQREMTSEMISWLFRRILAPTVKIDLISVAAADHYNDLATFEEMKKEQVRLLDYLEEQPSAIINGCAGSGKTVMAVERARRNAEKKQKTLFLCYNSKLKKYLDTNCQSEYIDVFNIDGWITKEYGGDYNSANEVLRSYANKTNCNNFPYRHIVVDEGQDFGQEKEKILTCLKMIIDCQNYESEQSSFFLFYDKNQLIQAKDIPEVIKDADCKLTLYCNCRNTTRIATFLSNLLNSASIKIRQKEGNAIEGGLPELFFSKDPSEIRQKVNDVIRSYRKNDPQKAKSIQILCALEERKDASIDTERNSCLKDFISFDAETKDYFYVIDDEKIPFSTCRKFKGLEADCVILVDINSNALKSQQGLGLDKALLYVGASRARTSLYMFCEMSAEECSAFTLSEWKNKAPKATTVIAKKFACKPLEIISEVQV